MRDKPRLPEQIRDSLAEAEAEAETETGVDEAET